MAGWNNKNCCCEAKAYTCADGTVDICCLTLEASTWVRPLDLYTVNTDPDDVCGYATTAYHHNNFCGNTIALNLCSTGSYGNLRFSQVWWGVTTDETQVRMHVFIPSTVDGDGVYVSPVSHEMYLDTDWYLAPVVFTLSGVTYTISVCPDPHEPFPEWPLTTHYLQATVGEHRSRSSGSLICGSHCDPDNAMLLSWSYNIYSDKITLRVVRSIPAGIWSGELEVAYDDGNWIDDTHTVTLTSAGNADVTVTVTPADSCTIPPPPEPCEVENACFPDGCPCITLGEDGTLYRTLNADISGPVTATGLTLTTYLNEGWDYSSGSDSIAIRCTNGGVDPYYVYVSIGGTVMFGSIPAGGFDCTPDGLDIVDITVTDGITTMVLYTL